MIPLRVWCRPSIQCGTRSFSSCHPLQLSSLALLLLSEGISRSDSYKSHTSIPTMVVVADSCALSSLLCCALDLEGHRMTSFRYTSWSIITKHTYLIKCMLASVHKRLSIFIHLSHFPSPSKHFVSSSSGGITVLEFPQDAWSNSKGQFVRIGTTVVRCMNSTAHHH